MSSERYAEDISKASEKRRRKVFSPKTKAQREQREQEVPEISAFILITASNPPQTAASSPSLHDSL
jgi:hypothetical protein